MSATTTTGTKRTATTTTTTTAPRGSTAGARRRPARGPACALVAVAAAAGLLLGDGAPARAQNSQTRAAIPPSPRAAVPPGQRPGPRNGQAATTEDLRKEIVDRMRELRAQRIAEALALDPASTGRLMPVLARYDEREMSLARERRGIVREIRGEVQSGRPDNDRLNAAIGRLLANRASRRTVDDERIAELRKLLTPVQQARLVLALPRIEREFSERLRELMRGRRQADADDAWAP